MLSLNVPKHHQISVEQIYKQFRSNEKEMKSKCLVDSNTYGKHKVYHVTGICPNREKVAQMHNHDEYAGYMPDYDLAVNTLNGEHHYLDGHIGVKYYIFDNEPEAIHFALMLDEYGSTDRLLGDVRHLKSVLSKIECDSYLSIPLSGEVGWLKTEVDASITRIVARKAELEHEAIILK